MGDLTDFERGQIVGAQVSGLSVMETAKLLNVSTETVIKVMTAYDKLGPTISAKENSGRGLKRMKPKKAAAKGKAARRKLKSDVESLKTDEEATKTESQTSDKDKNTQKPEETTEPKPEPQTDEKE